MQQASCSLQPNRGPSRHVQYKTSATPSAVARPCLGTSLVEELDDMAGNTQHQSVQVKRPQAYAWTKQWYPVAVAGDLKRTRPTGIALLGKDLVLWFSRHGNWQCFEDVCPHRLVPLSEGRIESDGTLQCAYHGWRFNTAGICTKVPQAQTKEEESRIVRQKKACVATFPTQVQHGVLWVWPDSSPNAQLECLSKQPVDDSAWFNKDDAFILHPWFMREVPYGQDVLLENLVDPAHVEYAHHAVFGGRDKQLVSRMSIVQPVQQESGCIVHIADTNEDVLPSDSPITRKIEFRPPTLVRYHFMKPGRQLILYCTPTKPGHSRIFYIMLAERKNLSNFQYIVATATAKWMKFVTHFIQNDTLDGDNFFLHIQDARLQHSNGRQDYFMPTSMDKMVIAFRLWLQDLAGPIPWPAGHTERTSHVAPATCSRAQLLDRYNQHTKHCKHCSQALQMFTWGQRLSAGFVAADALLAVAATGSAHAPSSATWVAFVAAALTGAAVSWQCSVFMQKFIFVDYVHAER